MYECDLRFEHCYAIDQDASAAPDAKKGCWRDWLHGYTYGQSRDRIEYAAARFGELSLDTSLPHEGKARAAGAPKHAAGGAAPLPTNAFAPPPNVLDVRGAASSASATAPTPSIAVSMSASTPAAECTEACVKTWSRCRQTCSDSRTARGAADCDSCDRAYRLCMPACFR